MKSARLILGARPTPWRFAVEPWALALDVPADLNVLIEIFDDEDQFHLEVSEAGKFLAFESPKFRIRIGDTVHDYDFGSRPRGMFDNLWSD
jgi:hypothetical protein